MTLSPEKLAKLRAICERVQDEYDREKFTHNITELIAFFEEEDRENLGKKPSSSAA